MWPFSSSKKAPPIPSIRVGEISVQWNPRFEWWEFSDGEFEYSLASNPEFNVAVIDKLDLAKRWLLDLDQEIDLEVKKSLEGWCEWTGEKHVVCIDVSDLISKQEIDVSFAGSDEWGDLGVNVVITAGRVTNSYAGD